MWHACEVPVDHSAGASHITQTQVLAPAAKVRHSSLSVAMAQKLQVLLTGGTAGIGLAVTKRLVDEGHNVTVLCRSKQRFEATTQKALTAPQRGLAQPIVCDVGCLKSVREAAAEIKDKVRVLPWHASVPQQA